MKYSISKIRLFAECITASRRSGAYFILNLLAISFVIRMSWIILISPEPVCDFEYYYNFGISIAQGRGFAWKNGILTAFWPVGYPAFLGMVFYVCGPPLFALCAGAFISSLVGNVGIHEHARER